MRHFDWNDLQAFLAIARTGRLTVAARRVGVDHSTLSRRIAGLEAALGTTLFDRRANGYRLTAEGERLVPDAEAVESLALRIRSRQDDASLGLSGTVRIGTPEAFGTYFLAPRLQPLTVQHPELEIELVANPRLFSLSQREADIAVAMSCPAQGRVVASKLADYELGLFASQSYVAEHGPIETLPDPARHTWVGYIEDLIWTPELNYLSHIAASLAPRVKISNVITQMSAVSAGVGLGVLPCFMARHDPTLVRLLPREIRIMRSYWMITHADTRALARVKTVADAISTLVRTEPASFWRTPATANDS